MEKFDAQLGKHLKTDLCDNLVSVIIPCYQQGRFLADAIESVLAQSHAEHEIIVVDDGSTDNTAAVAARYAAVRYVRQANGGTSSARNLGIRASKGTYRSFSMRTISWCRKPLKLGLPRSRSTAIAA